MKEIWKDIKDFEWLYQISNLWKLKRVKWRYCIKDRTLSFIKNNKWYHRMSLSKNSKIKRFYIHRLVAQGFLWLDINNKKIYVCHKDDNPNNNIVDNLFLWTAKDNVMDMINKWRQNMWPKWLFWEKNQRSKKVWQYKDWFLIKEYWSMLEAYRKTWIRYSNISRVCNKIKRHRTAWWFEWKFI